MDKERTIIDLENFKIGHSITHDDLVQDNEEYMFLAKFYYIEECNGQYVCFDLTKDSVKSRYSLKIDTDVYNMEDIEIKCKVYKRYLDINKNLLVNLIVPKRDMKSKNQWYYVLKPDEKTIISHRLNLDLYETGHLPIFDKETNSEVGFLSNKNLINKNQ